MSIGIRCWSFALAIALGLSAFGVIRADDDPLDEVKARQAVEAQRVEREFNEQRAEAYKLANTNLAQAIGMLSTQLIRIENSSALQPARRDQLATALKADIKKFREVADRGARETARDDYLNSTRREIARSTADRRREDGKATSSEADRIIGGRGRAVADARSFSRETSDLRIRVGRSVDESAVPEPGNIKYPKDWYELSKRRTTYKITAGEKKLMEALGKTISVDIENASFSEAIELIEKLTGQSLIVDKLAVQEAGVTYETTKVNLKLKSSMRSVLKKMLAELGLSYFIKNEEIHITTAARAKEETSVRTYYVGEVGSVVDVRYGPLITQQLMYQNVQNIINLITQIEPQSWKVNNPEANGVVVFDPVSMSLMIRQSAEFHLRMGGGLR
jgi:hypothetical protein